MRADAIDLNLFGRRLRVIVEDRSSREALRAELKGLVVDEPAPTGFVMRAPHDSTRLHVLLDRSGFVLGRARSSEECLGILGRHLNALAPAPLDTIRFRMRALIGPQRGAVLAGFPLFTEPAPVERRLHKERYRIVDRMSVDVRLNDAGAPELTASGPLILGDRPNCLGHIDMPDHPTTVDAVLLPGEHPLTFAQTVAELASVASDDSPRIEVLACAEALAILPIRSVSLERRSARYTALRG